MSKRAVLLILGLAGFVAMADNWVVSPTLPAITSMAIGGSIAYFFNWRGVFALYALLAVISTVLLFAAGKHIPSARNPRSEVLAPYGRLLGQAASLTTYLAVLFEGILIVGSFSYLGAFISKTYHYSFLTIGLIMTGFGVAAVVAGRLSGRLPLSSPSRRSSPPRPVGRPCRWWPSSSWGAAASARPSAGG